MTPGPDGVWRHTFTGTPLVNAVEPDSWEARMAAKAAERSLAAEAEAELARIGDDPHREHHGHLRGSGVECSCGKFLGVTCVAISEDHDPDVLSCEACGERGVVLLGPR